VAERRSCLQEWVAVLDHVTIRASDRYRSEAFYRTVLGALGIEPTYTDADFTEWDDFSILEASKDRAPTRHLHIGFVAASREEVDRFWKAGIDAGYPDDGAPGERPRYSPAYYGAFLIDPDANSAEAVHHEDVRRGGHVDHLWIGVRDLDASVAFYSAIARHTGLRRGRRWEEGGQQFRGAWATFSLMHDGRPPTEGLHIAFPAPDRQTVRDFHKEATAARYHDSGVPGVRSQHDPDYLGACVLDPDGNNVESVFHG
jgi:catechol 2,3-dioxygenase-like lactoylglutathione lyase family enzyme